MKKKEEYKQYTIKFLNRAIRFLASSELFLIIFYFFSNSQDFLDSNLFIILNVITSVAILAIIFSFVTIIIKLIYIHKHKNDVKYIVLFIMDILLLIVSILIAIFFSFIIVVSQGIF